MTSFTELLKLMRPHQWFKNTFVFAGLLFGHSLQDPNIVSKVIAAFIAFCLVSSAIYIINDIMDREQDRNHPVKKSRALAAGTITIPTALMTALILLIIGFSIAYTATLIIVYILLTYIVINLAYSAGLKNIVILDVFLISSGFILRLLAGTVGVGIPPSQWLILCGMMVALFLGFAKRRSEYSISNNADTHLHRKVLANYSRELLDATITITGTCTVITYSLYTMSADTIRIHGTEQLIYTVPLVLFGLFRYIYILYQQKSTGDPTRDLVRDPYIVGTLLAWLGSTIWLIS